jgi:HD-GYP domain-containing protein (c-di-GMP phosphodiesterase class II)
MIRQELTPIHPLALVPNVDLGINVYCWNAEKSNVVRFLAADQQVTDSTHVLLVKNPHLKLYVDSCSVPNYRLSLLQYIDQWLNDSRNSNATKMQLIVECVYGKMFECFASLSIDSIVAGALDMSGHLTRSVDAIEYDGQELQKCLYHDCSLASHSVNTAFNCLLISHALGYHSESLAEICVGAFLHDVGRIDKPTSTLRGELAPGSLAERNHRTHPLIGFRRLCSHARLTETSLLMCYQHHECLDGSGFPVGITHDEIQHQSMICSVASQYNELTSDFDPALALSHDAAMKILTSKRNTTFEPEILRCWEQIMAPRLMS